MKIPITILLTPNALELVQDDLEKLLAKKHTVIKTLLMDQMVMRGIDSQELFMA